MRLSGDRAWDKTAASSILFVCAAIFTMQLIFFSFLPLFFFCLFKETTVSPHAGSLSCAAVGALTLCLLGWRLQAAVFLAQVIGQWHLLEINCISWLRNKKNVLVRKPFLNTGKIMIKLMHLYQLLTDIIMSYQ